MKNSEMMLLAGAALVLVLVLRSRSAGAKSPPSTYSQAINNPSRPGDAAYGWQYFTGGTVIDPDGAYWKDGRIVWAPGLDAFW